MAQVNVSKDTAAIQALYEAVTRSLASGQSPQAVARRLIKRGMPPEPANRLVAEASAAVNVFQKSPEGRRAMVKRYQGRMIRGLLWAVGGLLVTAITYSMASGRGGTSCKQSGTKALTTAQPAPRRCGLRPSLPRISGRSCRPHR